MRPGSKTEEVRIFGVDYHSKDYKALPPTQRTFDNDDDLSQWFNEGIPLESDIDVRLICVQLPSQKDVGVDERDFEPPLLQTIIENAIWKPEVYFSLTSNPAGGAAGLTDEPWRFILQTPRDGGPFCSLAMSRHRFVTKGIFLYDSDCFDPVEMEGGNATLLSIELQLIRLPHKVLQTHSTLISRRLAKVISQVQGTEALLERSASSSVDFDGFSRSLFQCNAALTYVERRSRFEQTVIEAMDTIESKTKHPKGLWPPLAPQRTAISSRAFDFESLPRRIENARAMISNLIQQRNERINIELTQASFRIAEATLSDSRSMKTIAILTMILLPGTAVASLFSMNMFDWSGEKGSHIASKWLWVYFVVTVPLTVGILVGWWYWNRWSLRQQHQSIRSPAGYSSAPSIPLYNDIEGTGDTGRNSIEMVMVATKRNYADDPVAE